MTTPEIISLIASSIIILILFYQNSIINKMKSFFDIFDIDKIKEYAELRVEGETFKHEVEKRQLKKEIDIITDKNNKLFEQLKTKYSQSVEVSEKLSIAYQVSYLMQTIIGSNLGGIHADLYLINLYKDKCQIEKPKLLEDNFLENLIIDNMNYNDKLFDFTENLDKIFEGIESDPDKSIEEMIKLKDEIIVIGDRALNDHKNLKKYGKSNKLNK